MKPVRLLDKYPIRVDEIRKTATECLSADELIGRLVSEVEERSGATMIGVFDHMSHVRAQPDAQIAEGIVDSKHLLFCLADGIPNPLIGAVRPRAISVVETRDSFVLSFLEAPIDAANALMSSWIEGLKI